MGITYQFLQEVGRPYGLTRGQCQDIIKRHKIEKRKIYGLVAVDDLAFNRAAESEGHKLLPGYGERVKRD